MNTTRIEGVIKNIQMENNELVFYINSTKIIVSGVHIRLFKEKQLTDRFAVVYGEHYHGDILYPSSINIYPAPPNSFTYTPHTYNSPSNSYAQPFLEEEMIILNEPKTNYSFFKIILWALFLYILYLSLVTTIP